MEFHKSLYKSTGNVLNNSPNIRKKIIKYSRQSKRNDLFQQNRIFSISPTPSALRKELPKSGNANGGKENAVGCAKKVTSQQESYVAKFLAWKKQKELERENLNLQKKRPFISVCSGNILGAQKSFAPENHKFRAPTNIVSTLTENRKYVLRNFPKKCKLTENREINIKKEKNFIALNKKLVSTPSKLALKPKADSNINSNGKLKDENKTPVPILAKRSRDNMEHKIINPKRIKALEKNDKGDEIRTHDNVLIDAIKQKPGTFVKLLKPITPMTTRIKSSNNAQKQGLERKTKPEIENKFKLPKATIMKENNKPKIVKPVYPLKKVVSIKSPFGEKVQDKKPFKVQKTPHKSDQKLKRVNTKVQSKELNKNNKKESSEIVTTTQSSKLIFFEKPKVVIYQETPDEHNENLNTSFVTSTRRKLSINSANIVPPELGESILSPIETDVMINETKNHVPLIDLFVHRKSDVKSKENEILAVPLETSKSPELDKTPVNTKLNDNQSTIYISPYVTLSRGKGNIKKEKKLRESIYILDESSDGLISAEMRRVQETVKYFRKMLNDEVNRLEARCTEWEEYVKNTESVLLEDYGNDMVNVAIGQTRLLLNKKFQQFKNLINRCEKSAQENNNTKKIDDAEKPILPEDLEGFWQMIYIQVDDIDERFRKLEHWRSNDWKDPEEIEIQLKPKNKNKLLSKVVKKKKTGPVSTDIRKKLKEMYMVHMEKKKQESEQNDNDIVILTPSRKSRKSISYNNDNVTTPKLLRRSKRISTSNVTTPNNNDTPRRKSLRIETVINSASKMLNENPNTPKHNMSQLRLISLIKTPCIACPGDVACSSRARKSILKTPGTQKRRQTVIFNEELQYKSPEKLCGSGKSKKKRSSSSGRKSISVSSQKKERKRSLNLRARRLLLDPEAKIEIPT